MTFSESTHPSPPTATSFADGRGWVLHGVLSSYVVVLNEHGDLVQRYWGPRLPDEDLDSFAGIERVRWQSSFQRPSEVEDQLPVDGGHRWSVPSLQVRFADQVRALDLTFESWSIDTHQDGDTLRLVQRDREFDLEVRLEYRTYAASDVIARRTVLINHSQAPVTVLRADSANWLIPDQGSYRLSTMTGYWGAETQVHRSRLPIGEHVLTSRQGVTGHGANPWCAIDNGHATEDSGEVRTIVLAWSGSWRTTTQRRPEGQVSVSTGFGHEGLQWELTADATMETPWSFAHFSTTGFGGASHGWHNFIRSHILPVGGENRPILYNSWEAIGFDIDEEKQLELAELASDLGVELYVMDDGWFGNRADDHAGLGDWYPRRDRFPNGLDRLVNHVRDLNMQFGIWVEPEMVNVDSELYRAHPDWILHWPRRPKSERRFQLVLNFAIEEVRVWAIEWLTHLVTMTGLHFLKWDMNRPFTEAGWPGEASQDWVWIEHVRGVYHVIDVLRAKFSGIRIEACSSGGARVDLGILGRTDQVWVSDNTDALDRQVIQDGFSQLYPAGIMGAWVTDEVNPMTQREIPLSYRFDVAMSGVLGIGSDIRSWDESERSYARERIEQYKRIRDTVQQGRQYRLGGLPGRDFSAIQYVDEKHVVLFQYEPHRSLSAAPRRLRLVGLDPDAWYRDEGGEKHSGALLMGYGIRTLPLFTDRGWDNIRFSARDYASSTSVFEKL